MSQLLHDASWPSPIAAKGQPWNIDPQIACQIRCTAARMIGKAGLIHQDREDLEQELTAHLLSRIARFNPRRSSLDTFITRLLDNAAASIIVARKREKRDWRRAAQSLDEDVENEEGELQPLLELLDLEQGLKGDPLAHEAHRERQALRIDLERVMATLSEQERQICMLLMQEKSRQVARRLGLPRATLYDLTIKLRERFEAAGLKKYL